MTYPDSVRSRQLQTVCKNVAVAAASVNLGGLVPAGMKRWVTFLMVAPTRATAVRSCPSGILYMASVATQYPTAASVKLITHRKRTIRFTGRLASCTNCERPYCDPKAGPEPDSPLFSIAGGKYLGASSSQQTMNVFMQYFDE